MYQNPGRGDSGGGGGDSGGGSGGLLWVVVE